MQHVYLTVDLGFGDAGKGSMVDFLARSDGAHTVVRYNGGAQAAHRVLTDELAPRDHVFAQFGSGTLAGAGTHLSRFMLLDPLAMLAEERHLQSLGVRDAFGRTTIDERALVISPYQRAANRLKELARGMRRHGSCGMGIGETMADFIEHGERVLFAGDLRDPAILQSKLEFLRAINLAKLRQLQPMLPDDELVRLEGEPLVDPSWSDWLPGAYREFTAQARIVGGDHLHRLLRQPGTVIFEGAQGVLLDQALGFHPYTTWSNTTLENAHRLLEEAGYAGRITRIGITRAYATRHGAGPFVTEDPALTRALPDACNRFGAWQHGFRAGWLDLVMLRYAVAAAGRLDALAVTCLDRLAEISAPQICRRYRSGSACVERIAGSPSLVGQEQLTRKLLRCQPVLEAVADAGAVPELLAADLKLPIGLISTGPTAADKQFSFALR